MLHVRICAGGAGRLASLPQPRAPIQARNGWRPHGRRLGQPAIPSKDGRNFVQTMGSTSASGIHQTWIHSPYPFIFIRRARSLSDSLRDLECATFFNNIARNIQMNSTRLTPIGKSGSPFGQSHTHETRKSLPVPAGL